MKQITPPDLNKSHSLAKTRDVSIDILRFIGISLIILAHVKPEIHIFHLRCFDVPLMLFVSGLTLSSRKPDFSTKYFIHRITRLLLPVYVFLTVYFILVGALQTIGIDFGVRQHHIIGSYLLNEGIGYVWVIRVFLLIALVTPFLILAKQKMNKPFLIFSLIALLVIIDLLLAHEIGVENNFVRDYVYYTLGYSIPFTCGLIFPQLSLRNQLYFIVISFVMLIIDWQCNYSLAHLFSKSLHTSTGEFLTFNNHKYPPQSYFILWGLLMSAVCYLLIVKLKLYRFLLAFEFIGCNTIWIYLYHIPLIQVTGTINLHWGLKYLIVYILAVLITFTQVKIVERIQAKADWGKRLQFLKG